jgi:hypothetical protein
MNLGYPGSNNFVCLLLVDFLVSVNDSFLGFGINYFARRQPTGYSLNK